MITKFNSLTKYLPLIENDTYGEWQGGETENGEYGMPYVSYTPAANGLRRAIYDFAKNNKAYNLYKYKDVFAEKGISPDDDILNYDTENADAETVLCMMMYVVSTDRFIEGKYMQYLSEGCFAKWLKRLKEIDRLSIISEIDKAIKEVWLNEICQEYGEGNLVREASLQCLMYHHLRNRLDGLLKENNLHIYPEFYFKDLKFRADLAIVEMDFEKDVYDLRDCFTDVLAIIEFKLAGGNSKATENYIKSDMPKIKEYTKNLNYSCQYYFGAIYETKRERLNWFTQRQTENWAKDCVTELNAGYENDKMIFEVNSYNSLNCRYGSKECDIKF